MPWPSSRACAMGPDTAGSIAIFCNAFPQYKILSATSPKISSLVQDLGFYIHFIDPLSLGNSTNPAIFQHVKICSTRFLCTAGQICPKSPPYNLTAQTTTGKPAGLQGPPESHRCPNTIGLNGNRVQSPGCPRNGKQIYSISGLLQQYGPVTGALRDLLGGVCDSAGKAKWHASRSLSARIPACDLQQRPAGSSVMAAG